MGEILDLVGGGIPSASIEVRNLDTGVVRSTTSDDKGQFALPLLSPGTYQLVVVKAGFAQTQLTSVKVTVTETTRVSIPMKIAGVSEHVEVQATVSELQRDSVALGRVVDSRAIESLPLANRNFTQIVDLSPGVSTGVNNAGELGPGGEWPSSD